MKTESDAGMNLPSALIGALTVLLVLYGGILLAERAPALIRILPLEMPPTPFGSAPDPSTVTGHLSPSGKPLPWLDELLAWQGRPLYQEHCSACHGVRGRVTHEWKTQNADSTFPPPPHDSSGHSWHHSDAELYGIVKRGGEQYEDKGFRSAMPGFGAELEHGQIIAVITYIKSLWGPDELAEQYELSVGKPFPRR